MPKEIQEVQEAQETQAHKASKTIYCIRSGLPLANITKLCDGEWPMFTGLQTSMLHPAYSKTLDSLISKFSKLVVEAEDAEWEVRTKQKTALQVTMSAMMYGLDAMWLPPSGTSKGIEPSLPRWSVVVGCATKFLALVKWYHYQTSKRLAFPLYRISEAAHNKEWTNFGGWLEEAYAVKKVWEKGRLDVELLESAMAAREEAIEEVHAEKLYTKIDFRKVWNWIDLQLADHPDHGKEYPAGRRKTFENLFMTGDEHPENWSVDDVEDLQFAVLQCCELGNDITFFITTRLNNIRAGIQDFFSSFTIIGSNPNFDASRVTDKERETTAEFFGNFDRRVAELSELPPAPKKEDFPKLWLFLKAQAEYNILAKRFNNQPKL